MEKIFIITDSLEKIFVGRKTPPPRLKRISVLNGETAHFQIAVKSADALRNAAIKACPSDAVTVFMIDHISGHLMTMPASDGFMLDETGLYPEIIRPLNAADIYLRPDLYASLWVEVDSSKLKTGENTVSFILSDSDGADLATAEITVEKIDARPCVDGLAVINWLHCDCLADYYNVKVFGNKHFEIIESFIRTALSCGINSVYVPCFTPALDTAPSVTRTPCQLVDIYKSGDKITFGWQKLNRFIKMCKRLGVRYYEICHLFSQWGAQGCPDIYCAEGGQTVRLFGRDTDSGSDGYRNFLSVFLKELKQNLVSSGIWDKTFLHISDEPGINHLGAYNGHLDFVKGVLPDACVIDALSDFAFAANRNLTYPVVAVDHTSEFIKNNREIFVYYCTSQYKNYVPNRFFNIPPQRNRILGMLMYRNGAKGFLHWGYNFYNSYWSLTKINPYVVTDAGGRFQSGDAFSVYPSAGGSAYPSTRLKVFSEGIDDYRALLTLESFVGRERVVKLIDDAGIKEGYSDYPHDKQALISLREKINGLIGEAAKSL